MRYFFNPCWSETASADNAVSTATRPAEAGKRHFIVAICAGFSASVGIKLLRVFDGASLIFEHYFNDSIEIIFPQPLECSENTDARAEIPASGTAGVLGKVNLIGFTAD